MKINFRNVSLLILTVLLVIALFAWAKKPCNPPLFNTTFRLGSLPGVHPDHIIFLWLENKDFDNIIGYSDAPYINSLVKKGTLFTNSHANTHPSYPNYVDFFAGDANGVRSDSCVESAPLTTPNLYTVLKSAGKSFAWYSEDLPKTGSRICTYGKYVAKHNPTTIFNNVPGDINKRFKDFPADYNLLENVVNISPNEADDMHSASVREGDNWVKKHLATLVEWCLAHNSIFVIYFDESGTDPDNRIPVIAVGQPVKAGYQQNELYDHFSWTKSVCAMFAAPDSWTDNVSNANLISGCWK
jgi:hypothetical protein